MTFAEAAMIMMSGSAVTQPITITENGTYVAPTGIAGYSPISVKVPTAKHNTFLDFIAKSTWSKKLVTIPINNIYHYTINLVLIDEESRIDFSGPSGYYWSVFNHIIDSGPPIIYDLHAYATTISGGGLLSLYKICWKNDEPLYGCFLQDVSTYVGTMESSYSNTSRKIYTYFTEKFKILWDTVSGGGGGITYNYNTVNGIKQPQPEVYISSIGWGGGVKKYVYQFDESDAALGRTKLVNTETYGISGDTSLSNYFVKLFSVTFGYSSTWDLQSDYENIFHALAEKVSGTSGTDGIFLDSPME